MKKIYLIGIGMGNPETLTEQARKRIDSSTLLIGAERMVETFPAYGGEICYGISPSKIMEEISRRRHHEAIAVIFSGDVGFFSGAKKLNQAIEKQKLDGGFWIDYETEFIPGLSSLQYFCARLKLSWEDARVVSLHGREDNLMGAVWNHGKVFFLTGGDYTVGKVCQVLSDHGLKEAVVHVGERLSYPDERIVTGRAEQLAAEEFHSLAVMLVENERLIGHPAGEGLIDRPADKERLIDPPVTTHGFSDELFLRGRVPMTKREIRSVSLSKLQMRPGDVVYDVGAGTGSVSVEMALQAYEGSVYAVEVEEEALALIRKNKEKFGAWNLDVVAGKAPEALKELPAPDRAFIGGSKGNLSEILELLVEKNPRIRVVVNAITLETVAEAVSQLNRLGFEDMDILQLFAARGKTVGNYHMMEGQNPIFIISGERRA